MHTTILGIDPGTLHEGGGMARPHRLQSGGNAMRRQRIVGVTICPASPYYGREMLACGHVGLLRPVRTIRHAIAAHRERQCRRCPIRPYDTGKHPSGAYGGGMDPAAEGRDARNARF